MEAGPAFFMGSGEFGSAHFRAYSREFLAVEDNLSSSQSGVSLKGMERLVIQSRHGMTLEPRHTSPRLLEWL